MAKVYFEKMTNLLNDIDIESDISLEWEVKHFFSGAALYSNKAIFASWSPVGLAFKLAEEEVEELLNRGEAKELKYFSKGHVKKGYVLFENPESQKTNYWKKYFIKASKQV